MAETTTVDTTKAAKARAKAAKTRHDKKCLRIDAATHALILRISATDRRTVAQEIAFIATEYARDNAPPTDLS
jgi:hypothetical protein